MYKKIINMLGNIEENRIKRTSDNAFIPFDPANKDYQEYLEWVADGNTPEEADEKLRM